MSNLDDTKPMTFSLILGLLQNPEYGKVLAINDEHDDPEGSNFGGGGNSDVL